MKIETYNDYVVISSERAVFQREDGSEAEMKFEAHLDFLQSIKRDGDFYVAVHEHGTVEWINKSGDDRDIITRLEI